MKIVVNNIDRMLRIELSKRCSIVDLKDNPDGAFMVWTDVSDHSTFLHQTEIISECMEKNIPLIIFDKYQKMVEDEITFLLKPGIFLWEPALNDRMFFSYQPHWGKIPNDIKDIPLVDTNRNIDLGYKGNLSKKIPMFEKYFKPISDIGEFKVAFVDYMSNTTINERVGNMGINIYPTSNLRLRDIKTTVLIGDDIQCKGGYFDFNIFPYLESGVIPLVPKEQRWYKGIFDGLAIDNSSDIEYFLKTYEKIAFGMIHEFYSSLSEHLPEAEVGNTADRIVTFLK